MNYKYFSADTHWDPMWLPRNTWQDRLPAALKSIGPRVVETDNGAFWEWEGKVQPTHRAADSRDNAKFRELLVKRGVHAPEGSLAPTDPKLLLKWMDERSIYASVFFSHPLKLAVQDSTLYVEMFRAYSDFVLEQNSVAPERLLGLPVLPSRFPQHCAGEVRRVARLGAKAVEFALFDVPVPIWDASWEPLWEALEDEDVTLCVHIGEPPGTPLPVTTRGQEAAHYSVAPFNAGRPVADLVMSAVFERHPGLRLCFGETRIGWVPFFVEWLTRQAQVRRLDPATKLSMPPGEYIKRNVVFTFEEDTIGARMCGSEWSGLADIAIWGSDYPHPQGLWGDEMDKRVDAMFADVPAATKRYVLMDHALKFFGVRLPERAERDGPSKAAVAG